jgi:hypothetical protein
MAQAKARRLPWLLMCKIYGTRDWMVMAQGWDRVRIWSEVSDA